MGAPAQILVIEDDAAIRRGVVDALAFAGHAPREAADGPDGLRRALESGVDLVLLDLALPGKDGLDVLRALRPARPTLPVIILTARGAEDDRVSGLSAGADDYVVKPFGVRELLARIDAVLRRSPARPPVRHAAAFAGGRVDFARRVVTFDAGGDAVELTPRENELLRCLAGFAGRPVSRAELLGLVWGVSARGLETRVVDVLVGRVREKLRDAADAPRVVTTVRGRGYAFLEADGADG